MQIKRSGKDSVTEHGTIYRTKDLFGLYRSNKGHDGMQNIKKKLLNTTRKKYDQDFKWNGYNAETTVCVQKIYMSAYYIE